MKEAKYEVGNRFYTTYSTAPNFESDYNKQLVVVAIAVIIKITIDKKNITYTVKEYLKTNDTFKNREMDILEKDLEKYHKTMDEAVDAIKDIIKDRFVFIEEKVAKEQLSDVLNGK